MAPRARGFPTPNSELAKQTLRTVEHEGPWFRIHRHTDSALFFGKNCQFRFDDPERDYGVLYAGTTPACAFLEVFARVPHSRGLVSRGMLGQRSLSRLSSSRPLRLVSLLGKDLPRLRLDGRIATDVTYENTRPWSRALHEHPSRPDGIIYFSRHEPNERSVAIFERAKEYVGIESVVRLDNSEFGRGVLAQILDDYEFALI